MYYWSQWPLTCKREMTFVCQVAVARWYVLYKGAAMEEKTEDDSQVFKPQRVAAPLMLGRKRKANSEDVGEEDPAWRSIQKDNLSCGCEWNRCQVENLKEGPCLRGGNRGARRKKLRGVSCETGTSLVVQWLRLHASNARDMASIPGQGTKIPHAMHRSQQDNFFK